MWTSEHEYELTKQNSFGSIFFILLTWSHLLTLTQKSDNEIYVLLDEMRSIALRFASSIRRSYIRNTRHSILSKWPFEPYKHILVLDYFPFSYIPIHAYTQNPQPKVVINLYNSKTSTQWCVQTIGNKYISVCVCGERSHALSVLLYIMVKIHFDAQKEPLSWWGGFPGNFTIDFQFSSTSSTLTATKNRHEAMVKTIDEPSVVNR